MITSKTKLEELIHIERQAIPPDFCDSIVNNIENNSWSTHEWTTSEFDIFSHKDKELDISFPQNDDSDIIYPFVANVVDDYQEKYASDNIVSRLDGLRFNRYSENQIMRNHIDHIYSLFDGDKRGIPVLSIIGNLNDDYEGAKLTFWNDYSLDLGKGDLVIWPSLFLYPHRVTETTKNKRYSFVCWAY